MVACMWRAMTTSRRSADGDLRALQFTADRAGLALACPFSSSDEFESAVVRAKLEAGIYGPKRQRRRMLYAAAAVALLVIPLWMI
jgi:hypothetical protein